MSYLFHWPNHVLHKALYGDLYLVRRRRKKSQLPNLIRQNILFQGVQIFIFACVIRVSVFNCSAVPESVFLL